MKHSVVAEAVKDLLNAANIGAGGSTGGITATRAWRPRTSLTTQEEAVYFVVPAGFEGELSASNRGQTRMEHTVDIVAVEPDESQATANADAFCGILEDIADFFHIGKEISAGIFVIGVRFDPTMEAEGEDKFLNYAGRVRLTIREDRDDQ